jgi:hypothetical protein
MASVGEAMAKQKRETARAPGVVDVVKATAKDFPVISARCALPRSATTRCSLCRPSSFCSSSSLVSSGIRRPSRQETRLPHPGWRGNDRGVLRRKRPLERDERSRL